MRLRKFLLIFCFSLLALGMLGAILAPFAVKAGVRFWIARTAQQEGVRIECGAIEAPLLRPVVLHDLRVSSDPETPFQIAIESARVELALNLSALFNGTRGHPLRALTSDGIRIDIRRNPQSTTKSFAWRTMADLLADNFMLSGVELHVENGETVVDLREGRMYVNQIEAGVFSAREVTVASPWFRKSFPNLRGATSWRENRLSIGALTLTRGLDVDAISIDLSQLGQSRIGFDVSLDAFGGKLRASVSSDDHADKRSWDVAGTASEISLAQMSDALDLVDCAGGSLRGCKFTFRGDTTNLRQATATVWAEVTGLTWRDRTADSIIIGASLYNHQIQIEQVFVKQRANQLTLTGESALPEKLADWLNPDFRGDVSASINDLGDFARLFGAQPADFAGKIDVFGKVNAKERKLGGQLNLVGKSLTLFRAPVESLDVKLSLNESILEIANFELCQDNDFFRGKATIDLAHNGSYSGKSEISVADAADYTDLLPSVLKAVPISGGVTIDWSGNGSETAHSGTFTLRGYGLHPVGTFITPFEADLDGEYSTEGIYFRRFNLSNPTASFDALITLAGDYLQLESLHFDLNGKSILRGDVFLPVSLAKMEGPRQWIAALSDNPVFSVDLDLDMIDLSELARAISTQPKMWGQASGNFQLFGPVTGLDGKSSLHLNNFILGNEPHLSILLETRITGNTLNGRANALGFGSNPVDLQWSMPYQFEKQTTGYAWNGDPAVSATINFPLLLLSKLPRYVTRGILADGILSGHVALSETLSHPNLLGDLQLINARFLGGLGLGAKLTFEGKNATIDFGRLSRDHAQYGIRGDLDFRDPTAITARLVPDTPMVSLSSMEPGDCLNAIEFSAATVTNSRRERIGEFNFQGNLSTWEWAISLRDKPIEDPAEAVLGGDLLRTYPFCSNEQNIGKTLTLGTARSFIP